MRYRTNRRTGDQISEIGLGSAYIYKADHDEAVRTLRHAFENGINYFDLAAGDASAFPLYGEAFRDVRDRVIYQIHFGADYSAGEYGWSLDLDTIRKSVAWQLEQLHTDYIDYGFIHCQDEDSDWETYKKNGILDYILELKDKGIVRHIGLSSHTPSVIMHILDEVRADIPGISLFEFLLTRKDFPWPDFTGREMTLQDCFRARGKHGLQNAVRECLKNMHVSYVEMEHNRDEEEFDGSFRLHDPFPNNMKEAPAYYAQYLPAYVTPLPKEEWQGYYEEQAKKYTTDEVVGYCNTCVTGAQEGLLASARADARDEARAQARDGGAKAWHLAQLIFG